MNLTRRQATADNRLFTIVFAGLILLAWVMLVMLQNSPYAELAGHEAFAQEVDDGHGDHTAVHQDDHDGAQHGSTPELRLGVFLSSWVLMTVAMMLPGSLPLLHRRLEPSRALSHGNRSLIAYVLGYLSAWIVFGLLAYLGDGFLHGMMEPPSPLSAYSGMVAPAVLLVAGVYQLTPLKQRALAHCRLPQADDVHGPAESGSTWSALPQGLRLGALCVGSCWSLMLLMFALGHNRLDWMLVLAGIMAAERLLPWGGRLATLVGVGLLAWGGLWLVAAI
jgi:predicted metal-binding membrane protein